MEKEGWTRECGSKRQRWAEMVLRIAQKKEKKDCGIIEYRTKLVVYLSIRQDVVEVGAVGEKEGRRGVGVTGL